MTFGFFSSRNWKIVEPLFQALNEPRLNQRAAEQLPLTLAPEVILSFRLSRPGKLLLLPAFPREMIILEIL
jgi:hypothetical protein